jgi:hypothetical protein
MLYKNKNIGTKMIVDLANTHYSIYRRGINTEDRINALKVRSVFLMRDKVRFEEKIAFRKLL